MLQNLEISYMSNFFTSLVEQLKQFAAALAQNGAMTISNYIKLLQIDNGLKYLNARYNGCACTALAFHKRNGWW